MKELLDVREVPPDWIGYVLPKVNESDRPIVAWWAKHPNGTYTPVYTVSQRRNMEASCSK